MEELEQPVRLAQILEAMLPEIDEPEASVLIIDQVTGRVLQEELAAMPRRADARPAVDTYADVALARRRRLAGVDAHAHPKLSAVRPRVFRECALCLYRGTDGILRPSERYEESVPLRVDLVATVPCDHVAQEPAVALECVPVSISAQFLE